MPKSLVDRFGQKVSPPVSGMCQTDRIWGHPTTIFKILCQKKQQKKYDKKIWQKNQTDRIYRANAKQRTKQGLIYSLMQSGAANRPIYITKDKTGPHITKQSKGQYI